MGLKHLFQFTELRTLLSHLTWTAVTPGAALRREEAKTPLVQENPLAKAASAVGVEAPEAAPPARSPAAPAEAQEVAEPMPIGKPME